MRTRVARSPTDPIATFAYGRWVCRLFTDPAARLAALHGPRHEPEKHLSCLPFSVASPREMELSAGRNVGAHAGPFAVRVGQALSSDRAFTVGRPLRSEDPAWESETDLGDARDSWP
jgi:hypothetical protein